MTEAGLKFPDNSTLRDLGFLVVLSATLEQTMALLYCMVLDEDAAEYEHYLSGPSRVTVAGRRAVDQLRADGHDDLATELSEWNEACEEARQQRHRMVHSIPYASGADGAFFRWWHPKSGDVEKFDGVVALIMHSSFVECLLEGRALGDRIHDRVCSAKQHLPPLAGPAGVDSDS
ncbi:hypothetical protein EAD96_30070 [Micromonospora sp. BL1]|nr:hypothetical protein EAD96_30070 [Micromonospora sp. BL1]